VFLEQTATFVLYNINSLVFITEVESVYSAVRTGALYNTDTFRPLLWSDFDPQFMCRSISVNIAVINSQTFPHRSEFCFLF